MVKRGFSNFSKRLKGFYKVIYKSFVINNKYNEVLVLIIIIKHLNFQFGLFPSRHITFVRLCLK
jgi:hypothetical protein